MGIMRIAGIPGMSQATPGGEVNPHYRPLGKQNESLKGSLNKVVKYTEPIVEPAPSLGAVGHASAAPDAPEAGLRWEHLCREPSQNTGTNSCATPLGHRVCQAPGCPKIECEFALGRELPSGRDGQFSWPQWSNCLHLPPFPE